MAGNELMRLISGRMLGLGAGDIAGLQSFTRRQTERRQAERTEAGLDPAEVIAEAIDQATIVEGVDELIEVRRALDHGPRTAADRALVADCQAAGMSREELDRLVALARALRTVRSGTGTIYSPIRTAMAQSGISLIICI